MSTARTGEGSGSGEWQWGVAAECAASHTEGEHRAGRKEGSPGKEGFGTNALVTK